MFQLRLKQQQRLRLFRPVSPWTLLQCNLCPPTCLVSLQPRPLAPLLARAAQSPSSMGAAPTVGQPGTVSSAPTSRSQSPSATSPSSAPTGGVVPIVKFVPSTSSTPATPATPTTTATKSSVASPSAATVHVVVEGDTLTSIAKQYWGTSQGWENIVKANPGLTPTNLKIGAKLNIPAKDSPIVKTVATSTASGTTVAGGGQEYEVVSGDTLSQISNKVYGDSKHWNLIYEANKKSIGGDPAALVVGTKLTIPAKSGSSSKPISNATTTSATKSTVTPTPSNSPTTKPSTTSTSAPTPTPPIGSPTTKPSATSTSAPTPTPPIGSPTTKPSTTPTSAPTPSPPIGSPTKPS